MTITKTVAAIATTATLMAVPVVIAAPAQAIQACTADFTYTQVTVLPPEVQAYAHASCDQGTPDAHVLTLSLQRLDYDGNWATIKSNVWKDIPSPVSSVPTTYATSADCVTGMWRQALDITGSIQGHNFEYHVVSDTRAITPDICKVPDN